MLTRLIEQLSVYLENEPGTLVELTEALTRHNVNMHALSIAEDAEQGIVRLLVDRPEQVKAALEAEGFSMLWIKQLIAVPVSGCPGRLHKVSQALFEGGINIRYLYTFLTPETGEVLSVLRVASADIPKAEEILAGIDI